MLPPSLAVLFVLLAALLTAMYSGRMSIYGKRLYTPSSGEGVQAMLLVHALSRDRLSPMIPVEGTTHVSEAS